MHPAEWWKNHEVDVRTGVSATALDLGASSIALSDGEAVEYERLALATGATPRELPGARVIRTIEDSTALAEMLETSTGHLGVIGGGFIGVEAAASARMKGWDVTMAVPESVVWEHLFGAEVAAYFQRHLEEHGVNVNTGTSELPEGDYTVLLAGIGVTPNTDLADAAGLTVDKGVNVDEHLRATDDVWAVGDIAAYQSVVHGRRMRIEHWDVALNQGAYVGKTWAGKETEPYTTVPYFFSDLGDWTWFEYVGPGKRAGGRPRVDGQRRLRGLLPRRRRQGDGLPRREPLGRGERCQGAHRLAQWRARRLTRSGRPRHTRALAGEAWSESRARDAIAAICRDAEAAFDPERLWPAHPLDGEVTSDELLTLYLGGAGMVWALDRLARSGVHAPARDWVGVAASSRRGPGRCRRRSCSGARGSCSCRGSFSRRPRPPTCWPSRSPPTSETRRTSCCGAAPARCSPRPR